MYVDTLHPYVIVEQAIPKPQIIICCYKQPTLFEKAFQNICSLTAGILSLSAKRLLKMLDHKAWLSVDVLACSKKKKKNQNITDLTKTTKNCFRQILLAILQVFFTRDILISQSRKRKSVKAEFHSADSASWYSGIVHAGSLSYWCGLLRHLNITQSEMSMLLVTHELFVLTFMTF